MQTSVLACKQVVHLLSKRSACASKCTPVSALSRRPGVPTMQIQLWDPKKARRRRRRPGLPAMQIQYFGLHKSAPFTEQTRLQMCCQA